MIQQKAYSNIYYTIYTFFSKIILIDDKTSIAQHTYSTMLCYNTIY